MLSTHLPAIGKRYLGDSPQFKVRVNADINPEFDLRTETTRGMSRYYRMGCAIVCSDPGNTTLVRPARLKIAGRGLAEDRMRMPNAHCTHRGGEKVKCKHNNISVAD